MDEMVKDPSGNRTQFSPLGRCTPLHLNNEEQTKLCIPSLCYFLRKVTRWRRTAIEKLSVSQKIPEILRMFMVHCRVHKSPPLVPVPGQITPVYGVKPHFFKIHSNTSSIISSTSRSFSSGLLPSGFSTKILSSLRPISSAHLILLHVVTLMIFDEQHKS